MLLAYLQAALERAHYELIDDAEPFYAEVPGLQGVWATGRSLEECRRNLQAAIEDWVFFTISQGEEPPTLGSVSLPLPRKIA
jgi:predicted RNase H-like HicB family nuclease